MANAAREYEYVPDRVVEGQATPRVEHPTLDTIPRSSALIRGSSVDCGQRLS
jgi:hypothetical protein